MAHVLHYIADSNASAMLSNYSLYFLFIVTIDFLIYI
jgi:hypothetical protein